MILITMKLSTVKLSTMKLSTKLIIIDLLGTHYAGRKNFIIQAQCVFNFILKLNYLSIKN